ncbi:MAG: chemotaxis protein CheD [Methylocystaceae bacterium]
MGKIVQVGMADMKVVNPPDKLMTAGLGSCVGVCLVDKINRVAGMVHVMLPSSMQARNNQNRAKFADSGISVLVEEMEKGGAQRSRIVAKIAGGAQMFKFSEESNIMKIGERNAAAVIEVLSSYRIPLLANDTGGNYGRTIVFDAQTGELLVRTIGYGERVI